MRLSLQRALNPKTKKILMNEGKRRLKSKSQRVGQMKLNPLTMTAAQQRLMAKLKENLRKKQKKKIWGQTASL